jgi:4-amino-4-deoxy-L-arabinose transferase-like glycosyltransferase
VPLEDKAVRAISDAAEYLELGHNIAFHRSFTLHPGPIHRPELFRTPGWPLVIAPLARAFSDPLPAVIGLQFALSLLLVLAVFRFARELEMREPTAGLAALLVGISPNLSFLATKATTETAFTLLLVVTLLLFNRWRAGGRTRDAVGFGTAAGLLILIRPIALFFPPVLALLALAPGPRPFRRRLGAAGLALACSVLAVLPWTWRNARVSGRWLVSTAGEHNLFLYNGATALAAADGVSFEAARDSMRLEAERRFGPLDPADEGRFWQALGRVGVETLLRHPLPAVASQLGGFAARLAAPISLQPQLVHAGRTPQRSRAWQDALALVARGNPVAGARLMFNERLARSGPFALVVLVLAGLFQLCLLVLAVIGLARGRRRRLAWLLVPVLYFTLLAGPVGEARFRAPIEPLLCLIAAAAFAAGPAAGSRRRQLA